MTKVIRLPEEGSLGSTIRKVARVTGDPRADVLLDDLKKTKNTDRAELARQFAARLGEAAAEWPFHIPCRVFHAISAMVSLLDVEPISELQDELREICDEATIRREKEISESALAVEEADIAAIQIDRDMNDEDKLDMIERAIRNAAEDLGRETELYGRTIVERLFAKAGWRPEDDSLCFHLALDGAKAAGLRRSQRQQDLLEAGLAELEVREAAGLPLFEEYEVDTETNWPTPFEYLDAIAEREAAARTEAAKATIRAAVAKLSAAGKSLTLAGLLAVMRQTGRATAGASINQSDLADQILKAIGHGEEEGIRESAELSIEFARDNQHLPYDDYAVSAQVQAAMDLRASDLRTPVFSRSLPTSVERPIQPPQASTAVDGPTPFVWIDPDALPRRQWLYGKHLIRKEVSATLAPGGVGKTSLGIVEALALASGKPLLGIMPTKRCRVWLWNGEEPIEEMQRRIMAACRHFGLAAADIEGWLFVDTIDTREFVIAHESKSGVQIMRPLVHRLADWAKAKQLDAIFIDPFISTHSVNENDNNAIQKAVTAWKEVAREANCAISIAHHTRKLSGQAATAEDSRGAKSFSDKCRVARPINPMSKEEADRYGVPVSDRRFYFSIDPTETKANMSASVGGKEWFRSVSVVLGKGRNGNLDPGDSIGVVERWTPPTHAAPSANDSQLEALREAMAGAEWRAAKNLFGQPESIAVPIAKVFGLDLSKASDMRRAKAIFERLKSDGVLCEEKVRGADRKERPVVRWVEE